MSERNLQRVTKGPRAMLAEAMLFGSAALVACAGGDGKSAKTPQDGVLGATAVPSVEATIRPAETPTVIPTVAKPESLSPQELIDAGGNVSDLFKKGFEGLDVSSIPYDKIPQLAQRDLQSIQNAISICTGAVPFPYRDEAERQRMDLDVTLLATGVSGFCELAGEAALGFYNALGNDPARQAQFEQANMLMEKIHNSVVKDFQKKDSRIKDAFWQSLKRRFYPFGATGTSN